MTIKIRWRENSFLGYVKVKIENGVVFVR